MFDRKSQFDRSFFDRVLSGTVLPARIAGFFMVKTGPGEITFSSMTGPIDYAVRAGNFTVVAFK